MHQDAGAEPDPSHPLVHELLELISGSWISQALYVAAELRIADLLAASPATGEALATATGTNAAALERLLRALTTIDVCRQRNDGTFEITPKGALLGSDAPGTVRAWTLWWGKYLWPVWGNLLYSVRTGKSARSMLLGTEGFEHLTRDPEAAAVFNRAAAELTRLTAADVVSAYDFTGLGRIMDVGGGRGELLAAILRAAPAARGVLFDLPHATEAGRQHFAEVGLAARCEFVAGDFFRSVPPGADAYVLKSVIHDWNDERSRTILQHCRMAMGSSGRLLLVEALLPERLGTSPAHQAAAWSDLNMLVALAAKERTEAELRTLAASAGLRVTRVVPAGRTFSLLEAVPAQPGSCS
jgi:hypothetical protein